MSNFGNIFCEKSGSILSHSRKKPFLMSCIKNVKLVTVRNVNAQFGPHGKFAWLFLLGLHLHPPPPAQLPSQSSNALREGPQCIRRPFFWFAVMHVSLSHFVKLKETSQSKKVVCASVMSALSIDHVDLWERAGKDATGGFNSTHLEQAARWSTV